MATATKNTRSDTAITTPKKRAATSRKKPVTATPEGTPTITPPALVTAPVLREKPVHVHYMPPFKEIVGDMLTPGTVLQKGDKLPSMSREWESVPADYIGKSVHPRSQIIYVRPAA